MSTAEYLAKVLKEEYCIETLDQLDKAIARIGFVDITPFCTEIINKGESK